MCGWAEVVHGHGDFFALEMRISTNPLLGETTLATHCANKLAGGGSCSAEGRGLGAAVGAQVDDADGCSWGFRYCGSVLGECFGARKAEMLEIHAVTCWAS